MAHSVTVTTLNRAGAEARRRGDPMYYLQRLSPIHTEWHRPGPRRIGFLFFHWHGIENLKKAGGPRVWPGGVRPYTAADFRNFGWPYDVAAQAQHGDIDSLAAFSSEIEGWHNEAHMALMDATGTPMTDPAQNIFYPPFWRLHYVMNARFLERLATYDGRGTVRRQIRRLQRRQHSDVGRV